MFETPTEQFYFPVKIISGTNTTSLLGEEIKGLGCSRALLITDKGIVSAGLVKRVTDVLEKCGIDFSLFDSVEPDPDTKIVEAAAHAAGESRSDLVVALGGGSSIDTAKAASLLAKNKGKVVDYEGIIPTYKVQPLPIIAIPTTAGTGSEISSAAVITDEERHFKMVIKSGSGQIFAKTAILDPMNLVGIPARIAGETGIDALTHAIEASVSLKKTFVTDAFSLRAIRMVFKNLRNFVADTSDIVSAFNMLNASCLAGIAMTTGGLGLIHAMAHPLGAYGKVSHGLACGLLLPHVLEHNLASNFERYNDAAIAANPGVAAESGGDRSRAFRILDEVKGLLKDLHFPSTLGDAGISVRLTDPIINDAWDTYLSRINPRSTSREEVIRIFEKVL